MIAPIVPKSKAASLTEKEQQQRRRDWRKGCCVRNWKTKITAFFLTGVLLNLETARYYYKYLRTDKGTIKSKNKRAEEKEFICEYDGKLNQTNSDCYKLLAAPLQSKLAWHFFGDSQMGTMATKRLKYPHTHNIPRRAKPRCGFLDYMGMEKLPNNTWNEPNVTQGPVMFGFSHHYCSDLAGYSNTLFQSLDGAENFMEYLVVEYAQDVENQTPETATTQETTAVYLERQLQNKNMTSNDNVCVINTGLHDQNLCYDIRVQESFESKTRIKSASDCEDMYLQNVESYLKLLDPVCGNFVWIGISNVIENNIYSQNNTVSISWNEGVKSLVSRLFPEKSFYIDVWHAGSLFRHQDYIHFEMGYYDGLGALFAGLIL